MRRDHSTKVWHNPEIGPAAGQVGRGPLGSPSSADRRQATEHRAALEALFKPREGSSAARADVRPEVDTSPEHTLATPIAQRALSAARGTSRAAGRIVLAPAPQADPVAAERQRLLSRLLAAEGRPAISRAANAVLEGGFAFPAEQEIQLQLLEHSDEERVQGALETLTSLLAREAPHRRAVLESRLRRIEEFADERATRDAAEQLRRRVSGRPVSV